MATKPKTPKVNPPAQTPKAETPKAPAPKVEPKETKKLTFAELASLPIGDLATHLKKIVCGDKAIEKARDAFSAALQFNAKCVAALKRAYVDRLNKREIPPDTTFKKYFEQNAGGSLPGRVEAVSALFNALVLTLDASGKPLLSEEHFDGAAVDWLEKANAIVKHAMKEHGEAWKTSDDVLDVVNALSKPGDALKKIKEIRARQKGETETDGEETAAVPLTVGRAIEFLKAAIIGAAKLPEKEAYSLYVSTIQLCDNWAESGLADSTLNEWMAKYDKATQMGVDPMMEIIDKPAETPDAETPAPTETPAQMLEPAAIAA